MHLQSQPKLSHCNAHWLDELAAFDIELVHVPGRTHVAADALLHISKAWELMSAAFIVAASLTCLSGSVAHIDSGLFAAHNHFVHVCLACHAHFCSASTAVGAVSGAPLSCSLVCFVLASQANIAFLCGHVIFAQLN